MCMKSSEKERYTPLTYAHSHTHSLVMLHLYQVYWLTGQAFSVCVCFCNKMVDPSAAITETDGELPVSSGK